MVKLKVTRYNIFRSLEPPCNDNNKKLRFVIDMLSVFHSQFNRSVSHIQRCRNYDKIVYKIVRSRVIFPKQFSFRENIF